MHSISLRLFLMAFVALVVNWILCEPAWAQINRTGATNLIFYNASSADAYVVATLGTPGEDACPQVLTDIRAVDNTASNTNVPIKAINPSQGYFLLKRGHKVQILNVMFNKYTRQVSSCLQATNFAVNAVWQCPGPQTLPWNGQTVNFVNGSNAVEPTLNLPGTTNGVLGGAIAENLDLSCLNGANSSLTVTFIPPTGGPYWFTQLGGNNGQQVNTYFKSAFTIRNSWVDLTNGCDDNCYDPKTGLARPGVYPFGCSQCNMMPDPQPNPQCAGYPRQFCAARNNLPPVSATQGTGCTMGRDPLVALPSGQNIFKFGGTVLVTFLGPLKPPGTCK